MKTKELNEINSKLNTRIQWAVRTVRVHVSSGRSELYVYMYPVGGQNCTCSCIQSAREAEVSSAIDHNYQLLSADARCQDATKQVKC